METFDKVRQVIADTLNLPIASIDEGTDQENCPEWDSIAHVNIIMAVEQEFSLYFEVDDFAGLTSVKTIVSHIENSGVS